MSRESSVPDADDRRCERGELTGSLGPAVGRRRSRHGGSAGVRDAGRLRRQWVSHQIGEEEARADGEEHADAADERRPDRVPGPLEGEAAVG